MSSALNTHQADPECPSPRSSEASDACKELELDVIEWHQKYQSCQRYFIDHAQHSAPVQALCAFLNIQLPFQKSPYPVSSSTAHARRFSPRTSAANVAPPPRLVSVPSSISLIPFLRRLVAAGMDSPGVLHAFFGNDWLSGVGKLHEQERQNYLFAAKNDDGWTAVKEDYDGRPSEPTHALRQLQNPLDFELEAADLGWIEWFAMEDWAIGIAVRAILARNALPTNGIVSTMRLRTDVTEPTVRWLKKAFLTTMIFQKVFWLQQSS